MKISELRTSLWGYRKGDVCEYVAELDEQFSARLTERETLLRETADSLRSELAKKEEELAQLRETCERLRRENGRLARAAAAELPRARTQAGADAPQEARPVRQAAPGSEGNLSLFEAGDDAERGFAWKKAD